MPSGFDGLIMRTARHSAGHLALQVSERDLEFWYVRREALEVEACLWLTVRCVSGRTVIGSAPAARQKADMSAIQAEANTANSTINECSPHPDLHFFSEIDYLGYMYTKPCDTMFALHVCRSHL